MLCLFSFCIDHALVPHEPDYSLDSAGPVFQTWIRHVELNDLDEYLLLTSSGFEFLQEIQAEQGLSAVSVPHPSRSDDAIYSLVAEFCFGETEKALSKWRELITERPQSIGPDVVRLVTSLCLVNDKVLAVGSQSQIPRMQEFQTQANHLSKSLLDYLVNRDCEQEKVDAVLDTIVEHLPSTTRTDVRGYQAPQSIQEYSFIMKLSETLEMRRLAQETVVVDESNGMELDDAFESQSSQSKAKRQLASSLRDYVGVTHDIFSFRSSVGLRVFQISRSANGMELDGHIRNPTSTFVEHLLELSPAEICSCRRALGVMLENSTDMSDGDLDLLLETLDRDVLRRLRV